MAKLLRTKSIYGFGNLLPVGKTKFYEDFVHDPAGPEVQLIPGTNISRLKLLHISARTTAAFDDEVDELVEGLRRERDKAKRPTHPRGWDRSRSLQKDTTNT